MNTAIITYYTIEELRNKLEEKLAKVETKYQREKRRIDKLDQKLPQTKAAQTRLEKNYKESINSVKNSVFGSVLNVMATVMETDLPRMYEKYTGNKFELDNIRTRKDLLEFYIDIDEHKRMWCQNFGSTYKYKCTVDGKGIRYQKTPLITFEDYNGQQIS